MRRVRTPQPRGQKWFTFLHNHTAALWSCDFLQVTDLFFRPLFAFFLVELMSRRVIHVGVTRSPSDPWVAQQLRAATPYGQTPKSLICDNDNKFGSCFARVATTSALEILNTPSHAPRANAICERFAQECMTRMPRPPVDPPWEAARAACSMGRSPTSIGHGRIKGSGNSFQNRLVDLFHQTMTVVKSSPSRSWVDYTTTIEK
jgi:hypothetical protein